MEVNGLGVTKALHILKKNGYKYTEKRKRMLDIFSDEGRYMNAKSVLEHMRRDYPRLSFDTVYRNLALLSELSVLEVTELNGERFYRMACEGDGHHHHLICTACGSTRKIDICPMNAILGQPEGFHITDHKFEIYGYCEECVPEDH